MSDPIGHLPGISAARIRSARLETQILAAGQPQGQPVMFLHGNLSAATFWEETMLALPAGFYAVAPDQRGFGLSDPAARIDAGRGFAVWADDAVALADELGFGRFHLVAHSLGGCVAWALLGMHPSRLQSVTLVSPGPPCGFGGTQGLRGILNHDDGAGSGAGLLQPDFVRRVQEGEREVTDQLRSPRAVMQRVYWKPPFRPAREEQLLTAMLQVHFGPQQFPGDQTTSPHWPGFSPGRWGPINAMSPRYNQTVLPQLLSASPKPPLLWIYGADDAVVCDNCLTDAGYQGQQGLRPEWPGEEIFPAQPILSQVKYALDEYERQGGSVQRLVLPDVGHTPYLERPDECRSALWAHLT